MARRYDSRTTIFSPEGRLYQIEYAMEAISHAGTCIGILANDGVVLAAEKRVTSKLLDKSEASNEKIFSINNNILTGVAGITADANSLVNYSRMAAQRYLYTYDDNIPVEQLTQRLCDLKQGYTQYGGLRPFGVSLLYAGHDMHHGFQLYHSDPSGNYSGWKATCVGANNGTAQSLLKQDYRDGIQLWKPAPQQPDETESPKYGAVELAYRVLGKTLDATTIDSDKVEFAILKVDPKTNEPKGHIFKAQEIDQLLLKFGLAKNKEEINDSRMDVS